MAYSIPAKTFLLGEYVALFGGPAIIATTTPCFEVACSDAGAEAFHPDSPAGMYLQDKTQKLAHWHDPYAGIGGLGASSAQFLGAYLANTVTETLNHDALLHAYWQCAKHAKQKPSGYDVLAQASAGLVYLHHHKEEYQSFGWPFADIGFLLLHTGNKLATHHHLDAVELDKAKLEQTLTPIVERAKAAIKIKSAKHFIAAINDYARALDALDLVCDETRALLKTLSSEVLAAKGCGAMGADVLLLVLPKDKIKTKQEALHKQGFKVLASDEDLYNTKKSNSVLFLT